MKTVKTTTRNEDGSVTTVTTTTEGKSVKKKGGMLKILFLTFIVLSFFVSIFVEPTEKVTSTETTHNSYISTQTYNKLVKSYDVARPFYDKRCAGVSRSNQTLDQSNACLDLLEQLVGIQDSIDKYKENNRR